MRRRQRSTASWRATATIAFFLAGPVARARLPNKWRHLTTARYAGGKRTRRQAITITNCFDINEALHLQMVLGGAGIEAFITDEITGTIAPYVSFGSGLGLPVAEEDAEEAAEVIAREKEAGGDPSEHRMGITEGNGVHERCGMAWRRQSGRCCRFGLTVAVGFGQDRGMTFVGALEKIFLVAVFAAGASQALGEGSYEGQPLTQVQFNQLVPITYPLATTRFNSLKPTTYPVIQPGIARVHITEKLVRPLERPLLRTH